MRNDNVTDGPARLCAPSPIVAKMPAPTILPSPIAMSAHGPSARRSVGPCASCSSWARALIERVIKRPVLFFCATAMSFFLRRSVFRRKDRVTVQRPLYAGLRIAPAQYTLLRRIELSGHLIMNDDIVALRKEPMGKSPGHVQLVVVVA